MGQRKGQIPAHITEVEFKHPGAEHPLIVILERVEDPRKPSCNFRHSLTTILLICLVGMLSGAEDWEEIFYCAVGQEEWLKQYVDLSNGIPSRQTIERVMSILPTETLEKLLADCSWLVVKGATGGLKGDIVSFDGKTMKGTRGWAPEHKALHLLHAWSNRHRICLAQRSVSEKTNEITAIPELIQALALEGTIVTTDALNAQKEVATAIAGKKADYVLPIKGNHPSLLADIELLFAEADACNFRGLDAAQLDTTEKSGGRVEERHYALLDASELPALQDWKGATCVGRIIRQRTKAGKTCVETTYYLTTLDGDIESFAEAARSHWGVENGLHWSLDVIFREDRHRYQDRIGAANLSVLRKVALAILSKDTTIKKGRKTKMMLFATSPQFRNHILKNCF